MSEPSTRELVRLLADELGGGENVHWTLQGLVGSADAYTLASLVVPLARPTLVVAAHTSEAEHLVAALATFTDEADAGRIHLLPAREAPPLEMVSPSPDVEAARTAALFRLAGTAAPIVVATPWALAPLVRSPEALRADCLVLHTGDELDPDDLRMRLEGQGYHHASCVEEPGEYAARGGILDLWAPGLDAPCRIEFFGDNVESLRLFDPSDQRSFTVTDELAVLPSLPFARERLADRDVRAAVQARCEELLLPSAERRELDQWMAEGLRFPGLELLQPYVDESSVGVGAYLGDEALVVVLDPNAVDAAFDEVDVRLVEAKAAADRAGTFYPDPRRVFEPTAALRGLCDRTPRIDVEPSEALESGGDAGARIVRMTTRTNTRIAAARARVHTTRGASGFDPVRDALAFSHGGGHRVVVTASDARQRERLEHLLSGEDGGLRAQSVDSFAAALTTDVAVALVEGRLVEGFEHPGDRLTVIADTEIFGERHAPRRRTRARRIATLDALRHLEADDFVVHVDHGIGLYRGVRHLEAGGTEGDFLHIEYAGGDRYYLPVDRINLVEKYTGGSSDKPTLDKLGGTAWTRTKKRARDAILEMARELLDIEAHRQVHRRDPWVRVGPDFEEFEAGFPFEETEGQLSSIRDIVADLTGERPMDRVVCGDVGYGKTEVAVRAAYLAAIGGRQAAFLVPTTVLARQHHDTLVERFRGWPIEVGMLSRFQTASENSAVVERLADGKLDVVVGTHRLLQADVRFKDLGLLVVDEEHRFGVKAKEHVKRMRRAVDVLTMTATPIPRTLQLSLAGVRDLSLIETPPLDRQAVRTYVARYDEGLAVQAVRRELGRGGQVFFVHNRVHSIDALARRLAELLPDVRIDVAHGQMNEHELESAMLAFLDGTTQVLVCTTIIESGLDIPNANTIIIHRADTFGLAQLYQLRGRVGRSHRRAYAYLMIPSEHLITEDARKRLGVLRELDDLGAGFRLAARDMEIRGAGNLLGKQQSGQIKAIGFELFLGMLEQAAAEVRGEAAEPQVEPEIDLGAHAFLPENYIEDVGERLLLYRRLANAGSTDELDSLRDELEDRFGPLPDPARDFLSVMSLRPTLKGLAVESLKATETLIVVRFDERSPVDSDALLSLVHSAPKRFRLRPPAALTARISTETWAERFDEVESLLAKLAASVARSPSAVVGADAHA